MLRAGIFHLIQPTDWNRMAAKPLIPHSLLGFFRRGGRAA
jgi:hypothetical protein